MTRSWVVKPPCRVGYSFFLFFSFFLFSRQGFSVALIPVLDLALVDQAGLKLTEIRLLLPPKCWRAPLPPCRVGYS